MNIKEYLFERKVELSIILVLVISLIVLLFNFDTNQNNYEETNCQYSEEEKVEENNSLIKIDIKGEVKKPGVYELPLNSRVIDAINIAGGLTKKATTKYLNLSKKLVDENVIIISKTSDIKKVEERTNIEEININTDLSNDASIKKEDLITNEVNKENTANQEKLININTATKEELMTLSSIGEAKAEKIIEYRNLNGSFKTIEDIKNVSGIGDKLYDTIKAYITV